MYCTYLLSCTALYLYDVISLFQFSKLCDSLLFTTGAFFFLPIWEPKKQCVST